ncbi:hypothetical protein L195_g002262 [Trifolium pratense]|uniref:Uncharacterized protein n=1 Tax=Trifolium pratense TaxID=57577 RepID=A0A2K3NRZ5_TRIPR|nr:hypothetical protein L195_g002262 [Trifolium pratense]
MHEAGVTITNISLDAEYFHVDVLISETITSGVVVQLELSFSLDEVMLWRNLQARVKEVGSSEDKDSLKS